MEEIDRENIGGLISDGIWGYFLSLYNGWVTLKWKMKNK